MIEETTTCYWQVEREILSDPVLPSQSDAMPDTGEFISLSDRENILGDFTSLEVFCATFFEKSGK